MCVCTLVEEWMCVVCIMCVREMEMEGKGGGEERG